MGKITPAPERFWPKVQKTDTCWLWTGSLDSHGYGQFRVVPPPASPVKAYRFAYEQSRGPAPDGSHFDHLCRNRACVNPDHLEVVTNKVNTLRGVGPTAVNARKTHCIHGHELPPRVQGSHRRRCHTCQTASNRRYKASLRRSA